MTPDPNPDPDLDLRAGCWNKIVAAGYVLVAADAVPGNMDDDLLFARLACVLACWAWHGTLRQLAAHYDAGLMARLRRALHPTLAPPNSAAVKLCVGAPFVMEDWQQGAAQSTLDSLPVVVLEHQWEHAGWKRACAGGSAVQRLSQLQARGWRYCQAVGETAHRTAPRLVRKLYNEELPRRAATAELGALLAHAIAPGWPPSNTVARSHAGSL